MRVLITGVAGFIGSRLAEALLSHRHTVAGIDDLSTGRLANVPAGVEFVIGDVSGIADMGPFDMVYHCAASYKDRNDWERDTRTNVTGTLAVIRAAQAAKARLVYFQTALCYGSAPVSPVQPDAPLDPHGSYAVSKTAGEAYIRDSGLDYISFRLANVYGPRNLSGPIPTFYKRLTEHQPCTVMDSRRDFVFIDDLVWLAVKATGTGRGVYHVSSGADTSIGDLYDAVVSAMGIDRPEPIRIARGYDDVATILLDPSRTETAFGWRAQTSLSTGIAKAVEWYQVHPVTETYSHLKG
jgi:UDP-glucose 4-epimerase